MTTLVLTHSASLDHTTPPGHPERPDRIRAIDEVLAESRFNELARGVAPEGKLD
jgi:acetoin utilization deacetylase AcuC-like enzyme